MDVNKQTHYTWGIFFEAEFLILIVNVRYHDIKVTISFQRLPTHETRMLLQTRC